MTVRICTVCDLCRAADWSTGGFSICETDSGPNVWNIILARSSPEVLLCASTVKQEQENRRATTVLTITTHAPLRNTQTVGFSCLLIQLHFKQKHKRYLNNEMRNKQRLNGFATGDDKYLTKRDGLTCRGGLRLCLICLLKHESETLFCAPKQT